MNKALYTSTFVAAIGGLLFGFDTAVISGTIPFITDFFELDNIELGYGVSSALIGCIVGALFIGRPGDIFGRRAMLKMLALLFLASAIGTSLSNNFNVFIIFRFIGGIAVGGASVMSPMYISEIAPPDKRGRLVATSQLAIVSGILIAFFSNYLLIDTGVNNWRWMFLAESLPALLFFVLLFFIQKSPRFLVKSGETEKALEVIKAVNPNTDAQKTLKDIILSIDNEAINKQLILFRKPYLRLVLIGIAVGMFNQFTGINIIMYYAPTIFENIGFSSDSALMQTVVIGLTNLVFTIIAMSIIDKVGRKKLLIIGAGGMTLFLGLFSYFYLFNSNPGFLPLVFLVGFIAFFASSQGVVIWVILSEMFPNNVRARGSSIGSFSHWFFNALTSMLFPVVSAWVGVGYVFGFYTLATLFSLWFFSKFLFETKGKSLEEIEKVSLK